MLCGLNPMTKIEVRQLRKTNRTAGGMLIVATAIMFSGAAIGFFAPSLRDAPWTDDLHQAATTIAGNPSAYMWANGLIMAAAVLTALALVLLSLGFEGRARPWAWTAMVAFAFAALFEAIDRIISMQVHTWAALQQLELTDPAIRTFIRFQYSYNIVRSGVGGNGMAVYSWRHFRYRSPSVRCHDTRDGLFRDRRAWCGGLAIRWRHESQSDECSNLCNGRRNGYDFRFRPKFRGRTAMACT